MNFKRYPTVDDLRVKACFICLEQERYNKPSSHRRRWIHPCKCTLVAHESCLTKLVFHTRSTTGKELAKCYVCGHEYEFFLPNTWRRRILRHSEVPVNSLMTLYGGAAFLGAGITCAASAIIPIIAWCATLHEHKMRYLLGFDLTGLLMGEDSEWVMDHIVRFALLSLQSGLFTTSLSFLLEIVPRPPSLSVRRNLLRETKLVPMQRSHRAWPPSPIATGLLLAPATSAMYSVLLAKFTNWVMGTKKTRKQRRKEEQEREDRMGVFNLVGQIVARFIGRNIFRPVAAAWVGEQLALVPGLRVVLGTGPKPTELGLPMASYGRPTLHDEAYWEWYSDWVWRVADPVWFRNAIGFAIMCVARDGVRLLYKYLRHREETTRKIKNRDFSGIEASELDLIPGRGARPAA